MFFFFFGKKKMHYLTAYCTHNAEQRGFEDNIKSQTQSLLLSHSRLPQAFSILLTLQIRLISEMGLQSCDGLNINILLCCQTDTILELLSAEGHF